MSVLSTLHPARQTFKHIIDIFLAYHLAHFIILRFQLASNTGLMAGQVFGEVDPQYFLQVVLGCQFPI